MLISYFILFYNEDFILKMILFHFISVPVLYMFQWMFSLCLSLSYLLKSHILPLSNKDKG